MKRREFIALLGGAVAWPITARAQQSDGTRRIGALMNLAADDAESLARNAAFLQGLQEAGWAVGRNIRIDYRWRPSDGDAAGLPRLATELVGAAPDVILAVGASSVSALQQITRTLPIVFVNVIDPIGAGFVKVCRVRAATRPALLFRLRHQQQMAGVVEGGCSGPDAGGSTTRSWQSRCRWTVRCYPGCRAGIRSGDQPSECARRR